MNPCDGREDAANMGALFEDSEWCKFIGNPETLADLAVMMGWYVGPDEDGRGPGPCKEFGLVSSCGLAVSVGSRDSFDEPLE